MAAQQYTLTYDSYNNWLIPLNLAIGFHILVALSIVFLPGILKTKPKFEDIYTVNLINLAEPAYQQPANEPAPEKIPTPEPVSPKAVSIAEPVKQPPVKEINPVSLKPLKRKIKKNITPEPVKNTARQQELERLKREKLAEALRAEQDAAEQARIAAEEAARQQKLLENQLAQIKTRNSRNTGPPTSSRGSASTLNILERQYYTAIINRISQFWSLPEFKHWDPSTQTVVVIRITQNGAIVGQDLEKRSNDATFDQFVRKTLEEANPLPPIPPALRKNSMEIGLKFSPGSINF